MSSKEHRRSPRRKVDETVLVSDVMTEEIVGRIGNLSEGGMLLIPFQTAVLAHFLLGERLATIQWAAGGVLILGCALLIRARFNVRR